VPPQGLGLEEGPECCLEVPLLVHLQRENAQAAPLASSEVAGQENEIEPEQEVSGLEYEEALEKLGASNHLICFEISPLLHLPYEHDTP
jgi:hypothetical protein